MPPNFNGAGQGFNGGDFSDLFGPGGDIFSTLFGGARQRHGADLQTEASIGFKESIYGTELNGYFHLCEKKLDVVLHTLIHINHQDLLRPVHLFL